MLQQQKKDSVTGGITEMVKKDNHIDDNHITNDEEGTNQEVRIQTRKRKGKNTGKNIFGGIKFKLLNLNHPSVSSGITMLWFSVTASRTGASHRNKNHEGGRIWYPYRTIIPNKNQSWFRND